MFHSPMGRLVAAVLAIATIGGGLFVSRSAHVFSDHGAANSLLDLGVTAFAVLTLLALLARVTGRARGCALLLGGAFQGGLAIAHPLSTHDYGWGFFGLTMTFTSLAVLGLGGWRLLDRGP